MPYGGYSRDFERNIAQYANVEVFGERISGQAPQPYACKSITITHVHGYYWHFIYR